MDSRTEQHWLHDHANGIGEPDWWYEVSPDLYAPYLREDIPDHSEPECYSSGSVLTNECECCPMLRQPRNHDLCRLEPFGMGCRTPPF